MNNLGKISVNGRLANNIGYAALFFWGMHLVYFAFIFSSLCIAGLVYLNNTVNKRNVYLFFLFNFFVLLVYGFGYSNFIPVLTWKYVFILVFFSMFGLSISLSAKSPIFNPLDIICYYALGVVCKVLVTIYFSIKVDFLKYGYGLLYDPFTGMEVNSPSYASLLALTIPVFLYKAKNSILFFLLFFLTICSGLYLGSRTFLLCLVLSICLFFYNEIKRGKLLFLILPLALFLALFFYFIAYVDYDDFVIVKRISSLGLESSRFELWFSAIDELYHSPLGWYGVDQTVEKTYWYHNLWLDVARVSGIFGLASLLIVNIYVFMGREKFSHYVISVSMLLVLLVCAQDVIVEVNIQALMFYYLLSQLIVNNQRAC